jgi:hypothetical protein
MLSAPTPGIASDRKWRWRKGKKPFGHAVSIIMGTGRTTYHDGSIFQDP